MRGPELIGTVDTSTMPLRGRLALALACLFSRPVNVPLVLPGFLPRSLRRAIIAAMRSATKQRPLPL